MGENQHETGNEAGCEQSDSEFEKLDTYVPLVRVEVIKNKIKSLFFNFTYISANAY